MAFTVDFVMSASFHTIAPPILPKRPRTFAKLMCRMEKVTSLCALSGIQVEVCPKARGAANARAPKK